VAAGRGGSVRGGDSVVSRGSPKSPYEELTQAGGLIKCLTYIHCIPVVNMT
jgi:hypothetical protein